ncbi:hypothetical protein G3567_05055 [Psychroflexus sp. YR1-1]|uniref:DUF7847 domain-containing protein n=1 Tax=Psychroflexus aurantiacus TaxID=2709310 RepID=A0A6B3QZC1_9FLAO|nr:hypothetical protein [Psychroflexus aurantiacus]NEV93519.1 hypothetical protein [Psychroflexus aurantiacus]
MQNNYIDFKKERDLGAIISDTFGFIREEYKTIFRLYLKHVGWLLLLLVAASTYYQYQSLKFTGNLSIGNDPGAFFLEMISSAGVGLLLVILSSIAYSALSITTINSIIKSYVKNEGEVKDDEVSQYIGKFFSTTLGSFVVYGLMIFLGIIIAFLVIISIFLLTNNINMALSVIFTIRICLLIIVLIVVYFISPLSLMFCIIVFQEKSFSDAFSECFKLIKENWWITFATLLIITILMWLISSLFQIPIVIMSFMETLTSLQEGSETPGTANLATNWLFMIFYVLATLAQYILGLVTLISVALIYFNLNEFHNKTGTLEDIDRIGS